MSATHAVVYLRLNEDSVDEIPLFGLDGEPEYIDYRRAVCDQYEHLVVRSLDNIDGDPETIGGEGGDYELVYRTLDEEGQLVIQSLERVTEETADSLEPMVSGLEHLRIQPFNAAPPFDEL